jgi:hypothetical protein
MCEGLSLSQRAQRGRVEPKKASSALSQSDNGVDGTEQVETSADSTENGLVFGCGVISELVSFSGFVCRALVFFSICDASGMMIQESAA